MKFKGNEILFCFAILLVMALPAHGAEHAPAQKILNTTSGAIYDDIFTAVKDAGQGDTLLLGEGEFRIHDMLDLNKNGLALRGAGRTKTSLISTDMGNVVLSLQHVHGVTVSDMLITHAAVERQVCEYGVFLLYNAADITIENNIIRGSGVWGIDSAQPKGFLKIQNNIIEQNVEDGIIFRESQAGLERLVLIGNTIRDNGGFAFKCADQEQLACSFQGVPEIAGQGNILTNNAAGGMDPSLPSAVAEALSATLLPAQPVITQKRASRPWVMPLVGVLAVGLIFVR